MQWQGEHHRGLTPYGDSASLPKRYRPSRVTGSSTVAELPTSHHKPWRPGAGKASATTATITYINQFLSLTSRGFKELAILGNVPKKVHFEFRPAADLPVLA